MAIAEARQRVPGTAARAAEPGPLVVVHPLSLAGDPLSRPLPHRHQDLALARPPSASRPISPVFDLAEGWQGIVDAVRQFSFDNYVWLTDDPLYVRAYLSSLRIALISTFLALLVGYPIAYGMARAPKRGSRRWSCWSSCRSGPRS